MSKLFKLLRGGSLVCWVIGILGAVKPFEDEKIQKISENILGIWLFGHMLEMAPAMLIGRRKGLGIIRIVLKTMAYGFTWWLPLGLGIVKK